ncbi:hypothetical protein ILUMI_19015 [Ignelater luminosus]|uniref:Transposase Tc1-like domain-containing protein n=1 Tax=Ignelater luminosus TaxID=2038154 RepID=A0A8K0G6A1_IGNLU|nr:hypothetical protein ILUMI_19015 [Ignelater luminosus]
MNAVVKIRSVLLDKEEIVVWKRAYLKNIKRSDTEKCTGTALYRQVEEPKTISIVIRRNPGLTLRQGQAKLKQKNLDISYETIRIRLCHSGLKWRKTVKKPPLTKKNMMKPLVGQARTWIEILAT